LLLLLFCAACRHFCVVGLAALGLQLKLLLPCQ
jgi:hypothetical protein